MSLQKEDDVLEGGCSRRIFVGAKLDEVQIFDGDVFLLQLVVKTLQDWYARDR